MDFDFNKLLDKKVFNRQDFALVFTPYLILGYIALINIKQITTLNQIGLIVVFSLATVIFLVSIVATIRRGRDLNLHPAISSVLYFTPFVIFYYFIPSRLKINDKNNIKNKEDDNLSIDLKQESNYQKVSDELEKNEINKALWLKAEEEAKGDKEKIRSYYIKFRIKSLEYEDQKLNDVDYLRKELNRLDTLRSKALNEHQRAETKREEYEEANKDLLENDKELERLKNIESEKEEVSDNLWDEYYAIDKRLDEIDPERIEARAKKRRNARNITIVVVVAILAIWNPYSIRDKSIKFVAEVIKNIDESEETNNESSSELDVDDWCNVYPNSKLCEE